MRAVATAGREIPPLVQALEDNQQEQQRVQAELRRFDVVDVARRLSGQAIEAEMRESLVDWRGLLAANVQQARQAISKLLVGKLLVSPDAGTVTISGADFGRS